MNRIFLLVLFFPFLSCGDTVNVHPRLGRIGVNVSITGSSAFANVGYSIWVEHRVSGNSTSSGYAGWTWGPTFSESFQLLTQSIEVGSNYTIRIWGNGTLLYCDTSMTRRGKVNGFLLDTVTVTTGPDGGPIAIFEDHTTELAPLMLTPKSVSTCPQ